MFKVGGTHRTITQKDGPVWRDEDDREYVFVGRCRSSKRLTSLLRHACTYKRYIPFPVEECDDDLDVDIARGILQFHVKTIRGPSRGIDAVLKPHDVVRLRPQRKIPYAPDFEAEATRLLDESDLKPLDRAAAIATLVERLRQLYPRPTARPTIDFEVVKFFMIRDRSVDKEIVRPAGWFSLCAKPTLTYRLQG